MTHNKPITILQINSHIASSTSTGKQVIGLHAYYKQNGLNSYVAFSEGKNYEDESYYYYGSKIDKYASAFLTRLFSNRYGRGNISTSKLENIIKKIHPDVVQIHCINSYDVNIYKLFDFLKKNNIPFIVTEHAEFFFTGSCSHAFDCKEYIKGCKNCPRIKFATKSFWKRSAHVQWLKMKNAFSNCGDVQIVSVSPWLMDRSKQSGIVSHLPHTCIFNGFERVSTTNQTSKQEWPNQEYFLFVTSNPKGGNKGIDHFFKLAEMFNKEKFVVVGKVFEKDKKKARSKNITYVGKINNQILMSEIYKNAKATLIFSKVETFSMVVAESLCNGAPVFGFEAGGPESICLPNYCCFVKYGDIKTLADKISSFNFDSIEKSKMIADAQNVYSFNSVGDKYLNLITNIVKK